jgi:hypothetical protein
MSEHDLTALIRLASCGGARRGRHCPDEERLAAFVDGTLAGGARKTVLDHLAGCGFCCGQVAFLARAAELGPPPAMPVALLALAQGDRGSAIRHLRPAAALAAAVTVVAALLLVGDWTRQEPLPIPGIGSKAPVATPAPQAPERTLRNGRGPEQAPLLVSPSEGASLPRSSLVLRWQEAPGALFYTLQIVNAQGDVAWEGRSEGTSLAVPAAADLVTGDRYFAWVVAHLPSGSTVRSPAVGFRLAP